MKIPDPTLVAQGPIYLLQGKGGEVAKRSNAADCKSAGLRPSEVRILPSPPEAPPGEGCRACRGYRVRARAGRRGPLGGSSSVGRASAFQAEGRGSEPRLPLHYRRRRVFDGRLLPSLLLEFFDLRKPQKLTGEVVSGAFRCRTKAGPSGVRASSRAGTWEQGNRAHVAQW